MLCVLPRVRVGCRRSFKFSIPRTPLAKPLATPSPIQPDLTLAQKVGRPSIRKPTLFAVLGTCVVFTYSAAWTNIETDECIEKLTRGRAPRTWPHTITSFDMRNAADFTLAQELRESLKNLGTSTEGLPGAARNRIMQLYAHGAQAYLNVSEGKRLCWKICLLNIGVWVAWKSRRLQPFMLRNFVHDPLSGRSITMLTSMFSSRIALLLGMNLLFLDGFGSSASFHLLQRQERMPDAQLEATTRFHFLAFFISAGLFAALTSHIIHAKVLYPRLISRLSAIQPATKPDTWAAALRNYPPPTSRLRSFFSSSRPKNQLAPRFGGTGALYALMTLTALGFPNSELALFYPPDFSVPVQWGVTSLLILDICGIWRGWKFFDHFAHLGGALFGGWYYVYGPKFWNWLRVGMADRPPSEPV
ncbi:hypothetical protein GGX14DRAFT_424887 [Mycena pura]|uniref:Peptidase S54 rhomboid domain-containing protein n=1 Tax=Mycena pura TaxID=153505 RepID=A0AAD6YN05_9AGAR|nr:hypothetical protein GGX14DRAFT_424887 [Mycena pura]